MYSNDNVMRGRSNCIGQGQVGLKEWSPARFVYVCMFIYENVYATQTEEYMYAYVYVCRYVYIYIYIYVCMYV